MTDATIRQENRMQGRIGLSGPSVIRSFLQSLEYFGTITLPESYSIHSVRPITPETVLNIRTIRSKPQLLPMNGPVRTARSIIVELAVMT